MIHRLYILQSDSDCDESLKTGAKAFKAAIRISFDIKVKILINMKKIINVLRHECD